MFDAPAGDMYRAAWSGPVVELLRGLWGLHEDDGCSGEQFGAEREVGEAAWFNAEFFAVCVEGHVAAVGVLVGADAAGAEAGGGKGWSAP